MSEAHARITHILTHLSPPPPPTTRPQTLPISISTGTSELLARVHSNGVAELTLNRPQSYNALTLPMVTSMLALLTQWDADPRVPLVLVTAIGRAFCAGGDIKTIVQTAIDTQTDTDTCTDTDSAIDTSKEPYAFFRTEYRVDHLSSRLSKPYVSLLHGITMGGGCGVSMHGSHRVVTDATVVAMPETAIGLIPDVGGSHFLSRMPGQCGLYCALIGHQLDAGDALYSGVATHFVPQSQWQPLAHSLTSHDFHSAHSARQALDTILAMHRNHADTRTSYLARHQSMIDDIFSAGSYDAIETRLASLASDIGIGADTGVRQFARHCLAKLSEKSPTSLRLTFHCLRYGQSHSLAECLVLEYRVVARLSKTATQGDFFEGVRAKLIEKRPKPQWKKKPLSEQALLSLLAPLDPQTEGAELVLE